MCDEKSIKSIRQTFSVKVNDSYECSSKNDSSIRRKRWKQRIQRLRPMEASEGNGRIVESKGVDLQDDVNMEDYVLALVPSLV